MPWIRSIVVWLLIMLAESIHGTLRKLYLVPHAGDTPARRIGVFTGALIIFLIALPMVRWLGATRAGTLLGIGALWVVLTVVFELLLGRLVIGFDWARILSDYDLSRGGLMLLGLLAMLFTPWLAARVRGILTGSVR